MDSLLSTPELWAELKRVAEEMRLLRNSRSQLAGRRDPISIRNIKHLSASIRRKYNRHNELRELLIQRGEIEDHGTDTDTNTKTTGRRLPDPGQGKP